MIPRFLRFWYLLPNSDTNKDDKIFGFKLYFCIINNYLDKKQNILYYTLTVKLKIVKIDTFKYF
jgi:hypothetical protein